MINQLYVWFLVVLHYIKSNNSSPMFKIRIFSNCVFWISLFLSITFDTLKPVIFEKRNTFSKCKIWLKTSIILKFCLISCWTYKRHHVLPTYEPRVNVKLFSLGLRVVSVRVDYKKTFL